MKIFEDKTFEGLDTWWRWSRIINDLYFNNCHFLSCYTARIKNPAKRFVIKNIQIKDCTQQACSLTTTILDSLIVDGLQRKGRSPLILWGCVFRHVLLKGKISAPIINERISLFPSSKEIARWRSADNNFYQEVDWAIDISEAEFNTVLNIRGVPAKLIRRDPETQVIVRRESIQASTWQPQKGDIWSVCLEDFLESGYPDIVLVAGKGNSKFKQFLEGLKYLRDIGIADSN